MSNMDYPSLVRLPCAGRMARAGASGGGSGALIFAEAASQYSRCQ